MYDYVDFDESEEQSKQVREALVEQTINPVFSPVKSSTANFQFDLFSPLRGNSWAAEFDSPFAPSVKEDTPVGKEAPPYTPISPIRFSVTKASPMKESKASPRGPRIPVGSRVRYSFDDMMSLMEASLVEETIRFPESLCWLDKRVDLEDDIDDAFDQPSQESRSPVPARYLSSPYDHAPTTPTRLFLDFGQGAQDSPAPRKPWAWQEEDNYDIRTGMSVDRRHESPAPTCARKISLTNTVGVVATPQPEPETQDAYRTPMKQINRMPTKAVTSLKQKEKADAWRQQLENEKENVPEFPASLGSAFCTPPRRAYDCHIASDDGLSLYSRMVGFL